MSTETVVFVAATTMHVLFCWECGIQYAAPGHYIKTRLRNDDDFEVYCPNGHSNRYEYNTDDTEKLKEQLDAATKTADSLRRELVQEKHNAEQAEGRARDGKRLADVAEIEPAAKTTSHTRRGKCPKCEKTFNVAGVWLTKHLVRVHGMEREVAEKAHDAVRIAMYENRQA